MSKPKLIPVGLLAGLLALAWATGPSRAQITVPQPIPNPAVNYSKPNYAYSPILGKFVDSLPGVGYVNRNNLGNWIPFAVPNTTAYPGCDYYELGLTDYTSQMHRSLPATKLRGYYQKNNPNGIQKEYLGPLIVAQRDRPVRVKFFNELGTGAAGKLFLPVDETIMGAGMGPNGMNKYTQNRTAIHLHGGFTPWVSDGTAHQWFTPAGENTPYKSGLSFQNVPDMAVGNSTSGSGWGTYYYTNQQSSRFMFYHDHAYGITRLNVYAGEAAGYLLHDAVEDGLIANGTIPNNGGGTHNWGIPLIIQDKTFVSATTTTTDPLWDTAAWGGTGSLWFPHVYQPNQMPADGSMNTVGRWDYGPWFWPPIPITEPMLPTVSIVPEAFMDTPVVNGTAYPYLSVAPKAYRFRILNGSNDRMWNLQLYYANNSGPFPSTTPVLNNVTRLPDPTKVVTNNKEVVMVPADGRTYTVGTKTVTVPFDGRDGGVPDPRQKGPAMIQIGNECGFLPAPVVFNDPPMPVDYDYDRRSITLGSVTDKTLFLGPAERADVIIDFSQVPPGSTLILYNDAPAPTPLFDPRYDHYAGNPDYRPSGGAPSTQPGFGPNTRTIMQFRVGGTPAAPFNLAKLQTALPTAYAASHNTAGDPAYLVPPGVFADNRFASLRNTPPNFQNYPVMLKTITEDFDGKYGRMNAQLGTERTSLDPAGQNAFGYFYIDPPTETIPEGATQIWSVVHNGVDTHAIHFHLFNVQLINRVDWAGVVKPPEPNELGWKETIRMNPFENVVVAVKPIKPKLPFGLPKSTRPLDVTMPLGSTVGFTNPGPNGLPTTNVMTDFDWEYVWHCHLLGHEENDMMRSLVIKVAVTAPPAPSNLTAVNDPTGIILKWTDPTPAGNPTTPGNPRNEVGFMIQRSTNTAFTGATLFRIPANRTSFTDTATVDLTKYYYRILDYNAGGYSAWSSALGITRNSVVP